MHNSRLRMGLAHLFAMALGVVGFDSAPKLDTAPYPTGRHGSGRGLPNSASIEDLAARFKKLKPSCRPPARRHYRTSGMPADCPKRLRDRRSARRLAAGNF
jgi:hypothetical protein